MVARVLFIAVAAVTVVTAVTTVPGEQGRDCICSHSLATRRQVQLDMHVTLADGDVTIASSDDGGFVKMCSTFAAFVAARTAAA